EPRALPQPGQRQRQVRRYGGLADPTLAARDRQDAPDPGDRLRTAASRRRHRRPLADDRQVLGAGNPRERRPDGGLDLADGLLVGGARGQRHRDPARRDLDVAHEAEGDDVPGEARVGDRPEVLQELLGGGHVLRLPTTRVGRKAGKSSMHSCEERTAMPYLLYTIWRLWSLS